MERRRSGWREKVCNAFQPYREVIHNEPTPPPLRVWTEYKSGVVNGPLPQEFACYSVSVDEGLCWCKGPITTAAGAVGFRLIDHAGFCNGGY